MLSSSPSTLTDNNTIRDTTTQSPIIDDIPFNFEPNYEVIPILSKEEQEEERKKKEQLEKRKKRKRTNLNDDGTSNTIRSNSEQTSSGNVFTAFSPTTGAQSLKRK
eukprot:UN04212